MDNDCPNCRIFVEGVTNNNCLACENNSEFEMYEGAEVNDHLDNLHKQIEALQSQLTKVKEENERLKVNCKWFEHELYDYFMHQEEIHKNSEKLSEIRWNIYLQGRRVIDED